MQLKLSTSELSFEYFFLVSVLPRIITPLVRVCLCKGTSLAMVQMRFWAALRALRLLCAVRAQRAALWQLPVPRCCCCCGGVHVTGQGPGSDCLRQTPTALFFSQVDFWHECCYKGRDNAELLWVWWDCGSSNLDWVNLGQYFWSWGKCNTCSL